MREEGGEIKFFGTTNNINSLEKIIKKNPRQADFRVDKLQKSGKQKTISI
jgi:hypothetical protein